MTLSRLGIGFLVLLVSGGAALAAMPNQKEMLRQKAEQLCYDDVMRLCNDAVPDEDQVKACMTSKQSQLSPPCLKVFKQGMSATP